MSPHTMLFILCCYCSNSPLTKQKSTSSSNLSRLNISDPLDFRHIQHGFSNRLTCINSFIIVYQSIMYFFCTFMYCVLYIQCNYFILQCIIVYHYFFITITILVELQIHNYVCINKITVMQHVVCVNWNTSRQACTLSNCH